MHLLVPAGNYLMRYLFSAVGTAVVLPAVNKIGIAWFSTMSAAFLFLAAIGVYCTILWGQGWRERVDERKAAKQDGSVVPVQVEEK